MQSKSGQKKEMENVPYDLSKIGDDDLVVREEKVVSISWSRDNSPAPVDLKANTTLPEVSRKQLPLDKTEMSNNGCKLPPLEDRQPLPNQQDHLKLEASDKRMEMVPPIALRRSDVVDDENDTCKTMSKEKPAAPSKVRLVRKIEFRVYFLFLLLL